MSTTTELEARVARLEATVRALIEVIKLGQHGGVKMQDDHPMDRVAALLETA